jgi:hypothetical protein
MTGLDDENRELDDFLARRSVLHRRLADRDYHEPSQELDRLVLNKAREAIEVQASTPMYRAPRWALPVGLAASVVLALAVVVNFARMHGGGGGYPAAASASTSADAAPALAEREALPMSPPPADVALANQSRQSIAAEVRTDSADADTSRAESDRGQDTRFASNAQASAPAANVMAAKSRAHTDVQMPAEVHAASDASTVAGASAGNVKPAGPSEPGAGNSPRFARAEAPAERRVLPARDIALREAGAPASAAPAQTLTDKSKQRDPQLWMREIEQLRLAGKSADADREITAFRKTFPTLPVSPAALGRDPRPTK